MSCLFLPGASAHGRISQRKWSNPLSLSLQNRPGADPFDPWGSDDMAHYIKRDFRPEEVRAAGKALAGSFDYSPDVVDIFRIAHNFRMAHAWPLMRERVRLARISGGEADTSGRIKRMASIRKKLRRSSLHLDKMQDLAGIRAILPDVDAVRAVVAAYQERHGNLIGKVNDYIAAPKDTGYRSVHLVKTYAGAGEDWHGMKVELQIRTRAQHVWAAAQETVGIITGHDLKGGLGDPRWLRLMALVSAHMAETEGQPIGAHVPASADLRRQELRDLCADLGAIEILHGFKSLAGTLPTRTARRGFYLLSLDADKGQTRVKHIDPFDKGADDYLRAAEGGERLQSLMVAADSAEALLRTYPSYFLDIGGFIGVMRGAAGLPPDPSGPQTDWSLIFGEAWRRRRR